MILGNQEDVSFFILSLFAKRTRIFRHAVSAGEKITAMIGIRGGVRK